MGTGRHSSICAHSQSAEPPTGGNSANLEPCRDSVPGARGTTRNPYGTDETVVGPQIERSLYRGIDLMVLQKSNRNLIAHARAQNNTTTRGFQRHHHLTLA